MKKIDCRVCGGDGYSTEGGDCRACKGTGKTSEKDPVTGQNGLHLFNQLMGEVFGR